MGKERHLDLKDTVGDQCPVPRCDGILVSRVAPQGDLVVIVCTNNNLHYRVATKKEAREVKKTNDFWYW